jgi:hypothetical protein
MLNKKTAGAAAVCHLMALILVMQFTQAQHRKPRPNSRHIYISRIILATLLLSYTPLIQHILIMQAGDIESNPGPHQSVILNKAAKSVNLQHLLLQAGDIESNPGPTNLPRQPTDTERRVDAWFGYTQAQAIMHLANLRSKIDIVDDPHTVDKDAAFMDLHSTAVAVHLDLPAARPLLPSRGWTWATNLTRDWDYARNATYFHEHVEVIRTMHLPGEAQQIHYADSSGDGNCLFNSIAIHLMGGEYGHMQFRLRAALGTILYPPRSTILPSRYLPGNLDTLQRVCTPTKWCPSSCSRHICEFWNLDMQFLYPGPKGRTGTGNTRRARNRRVNTVAQSETCSYFVKQGDQVHKGLSYTPARATIMIGWAGGVLEDCATHYIPIFFKDEDIRATVNAVYHFSLDVNSQPDQALRMNTCQEMARAQRNINHPPPLQNLPAPPLAQELTNQEEQEQEPDLDEPGMRHSQDLTQNPPAHRHPPPVHCPPPARPAAPRMAAKKARIAHSQVAAQGTKTKNKSSTAPTGQHKKTQTNIEAFFRPQPTDESVSPTPPAAPDRPDPPTPTMHPAPALTRQGSFTVLTWNVQGLSCISPTLAALRNLVDEHQPDVMVLTETKYKQHARKHKQELKFMFPQYSIHHSCISDTLDSGPAAGVCIAIHKQLLGNSPAAPRPIPSHL